MLMRWSNDRLKATLHQVETPPTLQKIPTDTKKDANNDDDDDVVGGGIESDTSIMIVPERFSIAFFCNANKDVELDCLETCCGPNEPIKYPPINAHKYITQRLVDTIKAN
jgi:isopenicillin N synthase-like dioxygenase